MEPTREVREWFRGLWGAPDDEEAGRELEAWPRLESALAAVHGASVPMETEPATQLLLPGVEGASPAPDRGSRP